MPILVPFHKFRLGLVLKPVLGCDFYPRLLLNICSIEIRSHFVEGQALQMIATPWRHSKRECHTFSTSNVYRRIIQALAMNHEVGSSYPLRSFEAPLGQDVSNAVTRCNPLNQLYYGRIISEVQIGPAQLRLCQNTLFTAFHSPRNDISRGDSVKSQLVAKRICV